MQVQENIDLDFASGVKALLRQDPDIIMIGEIRDLETADIAIQAALTGHLVFSSLHTNDAPSAITRMLELGVPSGVQMVVIYAGTAVILSLVNSFGGQVVAGFGAAQRLDSIVLLPAVALGMAVNAMAAQNIGAGQWARVAEVTRAGVICNVAIMAAISGMLLLWAEPLVRMFVRDAESVAFGASYLRTIALFYPFIGLNFIFNVI